MKQYQDAFRNKFITYQKQAQREAHQLDTLEKIDNIENEELTILYDSRQDKVTRYLSKEYKQEFLVLTRIARDILSIPASGAGVERLFNYTRDIYHYRRGQLKPDTIKGLMLHHFLSKFELK
ncbi:uncharacterized protein N7496_005662 [Penicillium cataractarum]|uniref:HAT C-terminal dimerisation domain-containing protein n=1 Tax=Penicillium cataractarum TaxID=2100454 RepID=A0A9W9SKZ7_9EURO|nr:uncharacterized protein N7496_005662 [Penicillium cataractarum]KAJ5378253.1 hypothetical protein N7496_005662 [Penicillium cataractarum]